MNKRDLMFSLLEPGAPPRDIPAAFFMHFDPAYHTGQAAVEKHLEYFRFTGMDFVKIQFELDFPAQPQILKPQDWGRTLPFFDLEHYQPVLRVVDGLVKAAKKDALVLLTLYSPFMICNEMVSKPRVAQHIEEDPEAFKGGIARVAESMLAFVRACVRLGVDGFYASTQGGEAGRLSSPALFDACVRPYDLLLMEEINRTCAFNILHVCDYRLPYEHLSPFTTYPGHVVNTSLQLAGGRSISARQVADLFARPFMGGLERLGVLANGTPQQVRAAVQSALQQAPERTILAADCTVPSSTPWENLRLAVKLAHEYRRDG